MRETLLGFLQLPAESRCGSHVSLSHRGFTVATDWVLARVLASLPCSLSLPGASELPPAPLVSD